MLGYGCVYMVCVYWGVGVSMCEGGGGIDVLMYCIVLYCIVLYCIVLIGSFITIFQINSKRRRAELFEACCQ